MMHDRISSYKHRNKVSNIKIYKRKLTVGPNDIIVIWACHLWLLLVQEWASTNSPYKQ